MADDQTSRVNQNVVINVYPCAVPTEDQMRWSDALPFSEKRRLIGVATREGEEH
jgi:hypothetical protein